jgi:hypothetical protein
MVMRKWRQNWAKFNQVSNLASEDVFFIDKYKYDNLIIRKTNLFSLIS